MEIKNYEDGKMITLSKAFDTRPKILFLIYFIFFLLSPLFCIDKFPSNDANNNGKILVIISSIIFFICAYRYGNKAVLSEKCFINKDKLILIKQGLLNKKTKEYKINDISNFKYRMKPEMPEHPLNIKSFDALGFQTQQQVTNEMYGDDKILFEYNNATVEFGNDLYSWDYEKLMSIITKITGKKFDIMED